MRQSVAYTFAILCLALPVGADAPAAATPHAAIDPVPVNRSQRRDEWMARHDAFKARAAEGGIDLLFLGDSITVGWESAGQSVWEAYYAARNAAPFGINGDATQHLLWRLRNGELEGSAPRLIVLLIGTNNNWASGAPNTPQEIFEGVQAVVAELRARLPETRILLLALFPRGQPDSPAHLNNVAANRLIAGLDDGDRIRFRDINHHFVEADGTLSADLFPDGLHPNAEGYARWAAALEDEIAEVLGE